MQSWSRGTISLGPPPFLFNSRSYCHLSIIINNFAMGGRSALRNYNNSSRILHRSNFYSAPKSKPKENERMPNSKKKSRKVALSRKVLGDVTNRNETRILQLKQKIKDLSEQSWPQSKKTNLQKKREEKYLPYAKPKYQPLRAPFSLFISCLPGLEPLLLQEIEYLQQEWQRLQKSPPTSLNSTSSSTKLASSSSSLTEAKVKKTSFSSQHIIPGGVKLSVPSVAHLYILHLYLGTASHIYLRLNDGGISDDSSRFNETVSGIPPLFRARGFPELQRKLKDMIISQRWDRWLGASRAKKRCPSWDLRVCVTSSKSKLIHTKAVEERVRKTIGEVLGLDLEGVVNDSPGGNMKTRLNQNIVQGNTSLNVDRPTVRILVRIERDIVQLSLDTSSSCATIPMHRRGYRLSPFKAPLREDLAYALLMAGGVHPRWDLRPLRSLLLKHDDTVGDSNLNHEGKRSSETQMKEQPESITLFDPFCGSGTIAIEGAAILAGLPPGRFRPPPLEGTSFSDANLWEELKSKALSVSCLGSGIHSNCHKSATDSIMTMPTMQTTATSSTILVSANELDGRAISAAKANAKRAGLEKNIEFTKGSFDAHPLLRPSMMSSTSDSILLVTNPPYGKRMLYDGKIVSSRKPMSLVYKALGTALSSLSSSLHSNARKQQVPLNIRYAVIGMAPRDVRKMGLPLEVAFSTQHGGTSVLAMTGMINNSGVKA